MQYVKDKRVQKLVISEHSIRGDLLDANGKPQAFETNRVDLNLAHELAGAGIEFSEIPENSGIWSSPLIWVLLLIGGPLSHAIFFSSAIIRHGECAALRAK